MTVIRILDELTANKIAAGEVVERPASIVKELIENSIDAQSTKIEVEITEGGINHIRVTDNGIGMSPDDAQMAILRHATSKIRTVEDLYEIQSLGFRGEALPSIAAVSRFSLTTRQQGATLATYLEVNGGKVEEIREAGAGLGTTITVSELFFNTPARKKFLKTASSESGHIHDIMGKIALSRSDIAFKLIHNGRIVLATPGSGNVVDVAASLYGPQAAAELLPVQHEQDGITVQGFIGKPTILKSSRQWQTFAINHRVITSRMLSKALDNAYHSLLPKAGFPLAIIHLTIAPNIIDVNVHPQKSEVKFSDEQAVFRAVYRGIVNSLTSRSSPVDLAASANLANHTLPTYSVPPTITNPSATSHLTFNKRVEYQGPSAMSPMPEVRTVSLWKEDALPIALARNALAQQEMLSGIDQPTALCSTEGLALQPLGQVDACYIIAQSQDGLFIIDQHAAHERILYDRLYQTAGIIPAQQLLMPLLITMAEDDIQLIVNTRTVWTELGFAIEQTGPGLIRITELPADIPQADTEDMLREILTTLRNHRQPSAGDLRHAILQIAACRGAIKAGDLLNMRQMQALLGELCATTLPFTCPHGRPAMIRFSPQELAKMFKRT